MCACSEVSSEVMRLKLELEFGGILVGSLFISRTGFSKIQRWKTRLITQQQWDERVRERLTRGLIINVGGVIIFKCNGYFTSIISGATTGCHCFTSIMDWPLLSGWRLQPNMWREWPIQRYFTSCLWNSILKINSVKLTVTGCHLNVLK